MLAAQPERWLPAYPGLDGDTGNWTKLMLYDGEMGLEGFHAQKSLRKDDHIVSTSKCVSVT